MARRDVRRQFCEREPCELVYLLVQRQHALSSLTGKREDQLVTRCPLIYERQPPHAGPQARLLACLTYRRLPWCLTALDLPARKVPDIGVSAVAEQETSSAVIEERKCAEGAHTIAFLPTT